MNKTMNRADLMTADAVELVDDLNQMIRNLEVKGVHTTSWYGSLAEESSVLSKPNSPRRFEPVGMENRGPTYEALSGAADDARLPWYLYWEIFWLMRHGPALSRTARVLDAGGTSSLFSCYLASRGYEVHSVDLKLDLVSNADTIARVMGWQMHSYCMDIAALTFPDEFFDHAYSVCVFEHLDYPTKQVSLREIARCLKPGGNLCITFDYRNPAPYLMGFGADTRPQNQLSTPMDVQRSFLSSGIFRVIGNDLFHDDGTSWLVHPACENSPYTFGALFLQKAC